MANVDEFRAPKARRLEDGSRDTHPTQSDPILGDAAAYGQHESHAYQANLSDPGPPLSSGSIGLPSPPLSHSHTALYNQVGSGGNGGAARGEGLSSAVPAVTADSKSAAVQEALAANTKIIAAQKARWAETKKWNPAGYRFVGEKLHRESEAPAYTLQVIQQPKTARLCSFREKVDRRPVDPPPIVQVTGQDAVELGLNSRMFLRVFLVGADNDAEVINSKSGSTIFGTVLQNPNRLQDMESKPIVCFAFTDISVRLEGIFRFKFVLYELVEGTALRPLKPGNDQEKAEQKGRTPSRTKAKQIATTFSEKFQVLSPKLFPGMGESTPLTRHLVAQGLKAKVRQRSRVAPATREQRSLALQTKGKGSSKTSASTSESDQSASELQRPSAGPMKPKSDTTFSRPSLEAIGRVRSEGHVTVVRSPMGQQPQPIDLGRQPRQGLATQYTSPIEATFHWSPAAPYATHDHRLPSPGMQMRYYPDQDLQSPALSYQDLPGHSQQPESPSYETPPSGMPTSTYNHPSQEQAQMSGFHPQYNYGRRYSDYWLAGQPVAQPSQSHAPNQLWYTPSAMASPSYGPSAAVPYSRGASYPPSINPSAAHTSSPGPNYVAPLHSPDVSTFSDAQASWQHHGVRSSGPQSPYLPLPVPVPMSTRDYFNATSGDGVNPTQSMPRGAGMSESNFYEHEHDQQHREVDQSISHGVHHLSDAQSRQAGLQEVHANFYFGNGQSHQ